MLYILRPELHRAEREIYPVLHAAMEGMGCRRTTLMAGGGPRHLPNAEYEFESDLSVEEVKALAIAAVAKTGRRCTITVTGAASRAYHDLIPVKPRSSHLDSARAKEKTLREALASGRKVAQPGLGLHAIKRLMSNR